MSEIRSSVVPSYFTSISDCVDHAQRHSTFTGNIRFYQLDSGSRKPLHQSRYLFPMGRTKNHNPARSEKEQNRRRRVALFQKASLLAHHGADVYVVVRRYDAFHVFTSSNTKNWPPLRSEVVSSPEHSWQWPVANRARINNAQL